MRRDLTVHLVAVNPDRFSLGVACLHAAAVDDPELRDRIRVRQFIYDLDRVRHHYYDLTAIVADLLEESPAVLGLSCYSWNLDLCLELARIISTVRPGIRLVAGGPEIQRDARETLAFFPPGTYFVFGEGERTFNELLKGFAAGNESRLPPSAGKATGAGLDLHPAAAVLLAAEDIPSPILEGVLEYGHMDWFPAFPTSRGCLYSCSYCRWGDERGVRSFPVQRVLKELAVLARAKVNHLWIVDTIFGRDLERDSQILEALSHWPAGVDFSFELHPNHISAPLAERLGTLPLRWLAVGVQTASPDALARCRRGRKVEKSLRALAILYPALPDPRKIHIDLIFGLPGDDPLQAVFSLEMFKRRFPLASFYVSLLHVLPGTRIWREAQSAGWLFQRAMYDYELVARDDLNVTQIQALKMVMIGVDFLQYGPNRAWAEESYARARTEYPILAYAAGRVLARNDLHRHQTYNRQFYFDRVFEGSPGLLEALQRDIETALPGAGEIRADLVRRLGGSNA